MGVSPKQDVNIEPAVGIGAGVARIRGGLAAVPVSACRSAWTTRREAALDPFQTIVYFGFRHVFPGARHPCPSTAVGVTPARGKGGPAAWRCAAALRCGAVRSSRVIGWPQLP